MSFAIKMQGIADKLLNKFDERESGNKIQLQKLSEAVFDELLAEMVVPKRPLVDLIGVAVPYSQGLVDGNTIQSGDIKLTVTSDVEPLAQDKVIVDGVEYSIISIAPYAYTGKDKTIAYAIQIRN